MKMSATYVQKSSTVQKASSSKSATVLDSSTQSESLQRKADMANNAAQRAEAPRPNNTGMPDNLKSGIESLSGFSMDDVRAYYNSSKPATVQALAYTQGTDIHVAPGQEKCLPHEAWHVAQQMAGRVSPTTNINGMPVNDNAALEYEADVMGEKAVQCKDIVGKKVNNCVNGGVSQLIKVKLSNEPKEVDVVYYSKLREKIATFKSDPKLNLKIADTTYNTYDLIERTFKYCIKLFDSTDFKNVFYLPEEDLLGYYLSKECDDVYIEDLNSLKDICRKLSFNRMTRTYDRGDGLKVYDCDSIYAYVHLTKNDEGYHLTLDGKYSTALNIVQSGPNKETVISGLFDLKSMKSKDKTIKNTKYIVESVKGHDSSRNELEEEINRLKKECESKIEKDELKQIVNNIANVSIYVEKMLIRSLGLGERVSVKKE